MSLAGSPSARAAAGASRSAAAARRTVSVFTAPYLVHMIRVAVVLTVLAAALGAGRASGGASAAPCTRAAAKAAMLASPALRPVWPTLRVGGGVGALICHDFTRDGTRDMAATGFSGGTA